MGFFRTRRDKRDDPTAAAAAGVMAIINAAYQAAGMRIGERGDGFHAFNAGALDALDLAQLWLSSRLRALWQLPPGTMIQPLGARITFQLHRRFDGLVLSLSVDGQEVARVSYHPARDRLDRNPLLLALAPGMAAHRQVILEVLADAADLTLMDTHRAELRRDLDEILNGMRGWKGSGPSPMQARNAG